MSIPSVYICAAGHSGSTLLDLLLGSHSKLASLGEITQLPKNIALNTTCTCGTTVEKCELWGKVISELSQELGVNIFNEPYKLKMGHIKSVVVKDKNHQTRFYNVKMKIYGAMIYASLTAKKIVPKFLLSPVHEDVNNTFNVYDKVMNHLSVLSVVDSSKTYLKGLSLYNSQPERIRIIVLTRDARGVIYSAVKRGRKAKGCAIGWARHYKRTMSLLKANVKDEDWMHVRYEDIADNPRRLLSEVCDFIGIEYEDKMQDFLNKTHHITNGNDMRFLKSSTIIKDESWKDGLTDEDLIIYERYAGSINRSFGYE